MAQLTREFLLQQEIEVVMEVEESRSKTITTKTYSSIFFGLQFNYIYLGWLVWYLHKDLEKARDYLYLATCIILDMFQRDEQHEAEIGSSLLGLINIHASWHALVANAPDLAVEVMKKPCAGL